MKKILHILLFSLCSLTLLSQSTPLPPVVDSLINLYEKEVDTNKKLEYLVPVISTLIDQSTHRDLLSSSLEKMRNLAKASKNYEQLTFSLFISGGNEFELSNYNKAINYFKEGIRIGQENNIETHIINSYLNLGSVHLVMGKYDPALKYFFDAYHKAKKNNNYSDLSYIASGIANIYKELEEWDKSLVNYREALRYSKLNKDSLNVIKDSFKVSIDNIYLSQYFTSVNELDSAQLYLDYGWSVIGQYRRGEAKLYLLNSESKLNLKKELYDLAFQKEWERYNLAKEIQMGAHVVDAAIELAFICEAMNDIPRGIKYANIALEMIQDESSQAMLVRCYEVLAKLHAKKKDYKNAFFYQKERDDLRDVIRHRKMFKRLENQEIDNAISKQKLKDEIELERETTKNKQLRWASAIIAAFALLFLIFGIIFYRLNLRNLQAHKHIAKTNNLLELKTTELKKSNANLKGFTYSLSHDVMSQIDRIISFTDLQKDFFKTKDQSNLKHYLDKTGATATNLKAFCLDLITYFKVSEYQELLDTVDLNTIFDAALENIHEEDQTKIVLEKEKLPSVIANEKQMLQVFTNIISNAIKYQKEDVPLKLVVSTTENTDSYIISINDNGKGIDPNYLESIFDPFIRVNQSIKGSGLGLSICQRIIKNLNGRIWVTSELGKGATFYLSFPND